MARNSKFTRKSRKFQPAVVYGGKFKRSQMKNNLKIFGGLILLTILSVVGVLVFLKMNEIKAHDQCLPPCQSQQPEECKCNPDGSITLKCDADGNCTCKDGFTGSKCDKCKPNIIGDTCDACQPNFYNYPSCQGMYNE